MGKLLTVEQIRACLRLGIYVPAWQIEAALRARSGEHQLPTEEME